MKIILAAGFALGLLGTPTTMAQTPGAEETNRKVVSLASSVSSLQKKQVASEQRISELVASLQSAANEIAALRAEVQEVTRQNLALKKNLKLQPTIAEVSADGIDYRIVSVTGNREEGKVYMELLMENQGEKDQHTSYWGLEIYDETGRSYTGDDQNAVVKGEEKDWEPHPHCFAHTNGSIELPAKTPVNVHIWLENVEPEMQYVKHLKIARNGSEPITFKNLPVKWETPAVSE